MGQRRLLSGVVRRGGEGGLSGKGEEGKELKRQRLIDIATRRNNTLKECLRVPGHEALSLSCSSDNNRILGL